MVAAKWARTARSDLLASRHLLTAGDLPQAVFWLQQSAEKALKALILVGKPDATEEDLRRYGHQPLAFSREVMARLTEAEGREVKALHRKPHFGRESIFQAPAGFADAGGTLSRFEAALARNETPDALTLDDIAEKLAMAEHVEESARNPSDDEVRKWAHEKKGPARQRFISGKPKKGDTRMLDLATAREAYLDEFDGFVAIIRLDAVCYLLHPHAEAPRYGWKGFSPEEIYSGEHPIIAALPALVEYHEVALNALDRVVASARTDHPPVSGQ
jgi:HEPN domain-containing protein